ncbi:hypothetical protein DFR50_104127 [Roseiarcus fermentans]|uniref:Uncharacterized protein n=1 Tax=Roseiarcus fermentans TaxID=1473586 RepID=A0A366FT08_9HYPH|nr:hypothetical protein [Roseiarcus fermentans]RBP16849.1 hypothetical protein DFR50_104127 [Roseiarcus fermentans]
MLLWLWIIVAPGVILLADSPGARQYLGALIRFNRGPEPANSTPRPAPAGAAAIPPKDDNG